MKLCKFGIHKYGDWYYKAGEIDERITTQRECVHCGAVQTDSRALFYAIVFFLAFLAVGFIVA
jgi:hypothetical protein